MGIKGLLPLLKSIQKNCTLKTFSGQTIGIDAYGWLHRGVVGCAFALALGKPTRIHIDFVLSRVRMLLDFGITPYLVFDGDNIPSKAGTNAGRRKRREESRALGLELHKAGKTAQAHQELQKAVDVTPLMARQLIEELKKLNVQFVVAPYEADAQLVYLEQKGIIDGILSEDSDLLVFGAKRLLTKLNQYGELVEINRTDFALCKEINLAGWTDTMFRRMAILSGCDYLPNIEKLGLKTAHTYVRKHQHIEKILRVVQLEGKLIVPTNYPEAFRDAELTFLYHRVFCPIAQRMVFLNDLAPEILEADMPFLGPYVHPEAAMGVARGDLDPFSKKPIELSGGSSCNPFTGDRRRQTEHSSTELLPKKSIETFFRPGRQPLAELDPNSLTPSPSQQGVLQRYRDASWEPRLISSAPGLRRAMTTAASPLTTLHRAAASAKASALSSHQHPKRQRLCADSAGPSTTRETSNSRFFPPQANAASPLAQKSSKSRRNKTSDFGIYLDESVEDSQRQSQTREGANPDGHHIKTPYPESRRLQHPHDRDSCEAIPQSSPTSQSPAQLLSSSPARRASTSGALISDRSSIKSAAVKEIAHEGDPEAFQDLLEYHVRKQNEALMKTFAFQPTEGQQSALRSLPPTRANRHLSHLRTSEIEKAVPHDSASTTPQASRRKVNLQKTFAHQSPEAQRAALKSLTKPQPPSKLPTIESLPTIPTNMRMGQELMNERLEFSIASGHPTETRGSEDTIVPDSEEDRSETASPVRRPKFDLSAFAFVSR